MSFFKKSLQPPFGERPNVILSYCHFLIAHLVVLETKVFFELGCMAVCCMGCMVYGPLQGGRDKAGCLYGCMGGVWASKKGFFYLFWKRIQLPYSVLHTSDTAIQATRLVTPPVYAIQPIQRIQLHTQHTAIQHIHHTSPYNSPQTCWARGWTRSALTAYCTLKYFV